MNTTNTKSNSRHLWVKEIQENEKIRGDYLVRNKTISKTKQGNSFLTLILSDKTGSIDGKVWDNADEVSSNFREGDIVYIAGLAVSYKGTIQIRIHELKKEAEPFDAGIFQESTTEDIGQMISELKKLSRTITDKYLRALVESFWEDRTFLTLFKKAPAAKYLHHSYIGGLLEHTLSVAKLAVDVSRHYKELDGDLLLSGAILHDIGKTRELSFDLNIDYTDEGRLLGHIVLGTMMVEEKLKLRKDFPEELSIRLKHLILSHHGELDFGSPKRPKFLEAFALHLIDDMDAKINGLGRIMRDDQKEGSWTSFNNLFQRYFFKANLDDKIKNSDSQRDEKKPMQKSLFRLD
jgi:3'-5' exoribonuclease